VDFTDTSETGRRLRVNVESAGSTARDFLENAEAQLERRTSICAAPYHQVNLVDTVTLDGRPAAELEYTCGSGETMRHGIWRATVVGGKAYEFYLTAPDADFAAGKAVYDEAVRSYHLNTT
jgi:hypothetical protein